MEDICLRRRILPSPLRPSANHTSLMPLQFRLMLRLGTVPVDPPLILAPMAGITDHAYRLMLRRIGSVGLITMEFISSEAITRGIARQLPKMVFTKEESTLSLPSY